jgi:hypothetical protein
MAQISNAHEVKAAIFVKLSRSIEGILSKANQQFGSYRKRHPRKNQVNICVILNSRLMEYLPEVVAKAIHSKMKAELPIPRFEHIDAVIYISEKHFNVLPDGRFAQPIATYEGMGSISNEWKVPVLDHVVQSWSDFRTGTPTVAGDILETFETITDIPKRMTRSDAWALEYARNPYLEKFSLSELRVYFNRLVALNSLALFKGSWSKPPKPFAAEITRRFAHALGETNRRAIDMREMDRRWLTPADESAVSEGLPSELIAALKNRGDST